MIHRLVLQNFYSIRDRQVLDLVVPATTPNDPSRFAPLWPGVQERAPKVVALFGANASGKTNVLRALGFVAWFVKDSFQLQPEAIIPAARFNDAESQGLDVHIGLDFVSPVQLADGGPDGPFCRYSYELYLGGPPGRPNEVKVERLVHWPPGAARRAKVFERRAGGLITASSSFHLSGHRKPLASVLRPNASIISTLAQLGHKPSQVLRVMASRIFANIAGDYPEITEAHATQYYATNPANRAALNREVRRLDLGLREIRVDTTTQGPTMIYEHEGLAWPLPAVFESHGTRQFVRIFPLLFHALEQGGVAVIDELDASIHPLVLPEIIGWFYDPKRSRHDAQLWTTCQNPVLLEHLAKEEIFFCQKDINGRTALHGMTDIKNVRRGDNLYRKYLSGTFGAVPRIG